MVNALLAEERRKRGLPWYGCHEPPPPPPRRRTAPPNPHEGPAGHLDTLALGRLRTLIARMVRDDRTTRNAAIARAFRAATGRTVTEGTVRYHRNRMGLPTAPAGKPKLAA